MSVNDWTLTSRQWREIKLDMEGGGGVGVMHVNDKTLTSSDWRERVGREEGSEGAERERRDRQTDMN